MNARRLALLTALIVVAMPAAGAAASGATYGYVSASEPDWDSASDGGDYCDFTLQLPDPPLDGAPAQTTDALLQGATVATAHEQDPDRSCFSYLHTWLPVRIDPADRAHVHVALSRPFLWVAQGIVGAIILATLGVLLLLVLAQWLVKKRRATAA